MQKEHIDIYTDGSANCQNRYGGWAALFLYPDGAMEAVGAYSNTTNNQMEMMAVIEALSVISNDEKRKSRSYTIHSDSQLVVNGAMEWRHGWVIKNWSKVKNADLWKVMDSQLRALKDEGVSVALKWVRGHDGQEHNERCDKLARAQYNEIRKKNEA